MVTKNGIIKKTPLDAFRNVRKTGLRAIKLQKGDLLRKAAICQRGDEIILTSRDGKSIRFKEKDLRVMGRVASGVRGIRLSKGDEVVGMDIIKNQKSKIENQKLAKSYLLVVTENGYGKRTKVSEYRLQRRGGSGIKAARITQKTGKVVFSQVIGEEERDLVVISQKGQVIRSPLGSISILGRATSGVRVMRLGKGDRVVSAICL